MKAKAGDKLKVVQVIKKLNNTELGKGGTHDTYVLIPSELNISDIFDTPDVPVTFTDKVTQEGISVRNTVGREKRIVGLGDYYRANNLSAGDEIIFERREITGQSEYYIGVRKYLDLLAFRKLEDGYEILTPERIDRIVKATELMERRIEVNFMGMARKRYDSPESTAYYDILISGTSITQLHNIRGICGIQVSGNKINFVDSFGWKKYIFEAEEVQ